MSKQSEETAQCINSEYGYCVTLLYINFIPGYLLGLTGSYRYSFVLAGTTTFFFLSFVILFLCIYYFIYMFR